MASSSVGIIPGGFCRSLNPSLFRFVLAITTLSSTWSARGLRWSRREGKRRFRFVDPHWFRGNSYLKLGWNWIKAALVKGWELLSRLLWGFRGSRTLTLSLPGPRRPRSGQVRGGQVSSTTGFLHGDCQVWEVSNMSFVSQPGD